MAAPCLNCPRRCGVVRAEHAGAEVPGVCRSPLAPVVARAGLHHWEEPVISGTRGSGTVFFSGCNLHCVFCQNYEISAKRQGREITVERLREIYRELVAQGAHNINLVTPTHFADAVYASLTPSPGVPVVWNTNGYESVDTIKRFAGKVQIYLPDMKYADAALALRYSGAADYFEVAAAAIKEMFRQTGRFEIGDDGLMRRGVIVRHLILPGCVDNSLKVIRWFAATFKPGEAMFSLMRQYLPCGAVSKDNFPELDRVVSDEEYETIENALFDSGIEDGFVQDESSASSEFIPAFDFTGVSG